MELKEFFQENPRFAVAFSGGVDSSYLLYAAREAGCDVKAYFINSAFQPDFELNDARKQAYLSGIPLTISNMDIFSIPNIVQNPPDRCYYCKQMVFTRILELAAEDGYNMLCDGTNASDDASDRAGMRALNELGIRSPLRECGLSKSDIRRLSREIGLSTHDKPSYACLATRIPAGTEITQELLSKVDHAEEALHALGFSNLRVRYFGGKAKIQIGEDQIKLVIDKRQKILDALGTDFEGVLLDLTPRKTEV